MKTPFQTLSPHSPYGNGYGGWEDGNGFCNNGYGYGSSVHGYSNGHGHGHSGDGNGNGRGISTEKLVQNYRSTI